MLDLIIANILVLITPGLNFLLVMQTSTTYGRKAGLSIALGVTCAIFLHALCAAIGIHIVLDKFPEIIFYIKIIGGIYLFILASIFLKKFINNDKASSSQIKFDRISHLKCFGTGFLVDLTNPYVILFYVSQFALASQKDFNYIFLLLLILAITLLWFCTIAFFFANNLIRKWFYKIERLIYLISSLYIYSLSYKLIM